MFGEIHKIDKILGGVGVGVYGSLAIFMISKNFIISIINDPLNK